MESAAVLSDDGRYRYSLTRRWGDGPSVTWIMLNPSTADAQQDDPTIRRCIGFSKAWGYSSLAVVNLYPIRATDPRDALYWARFPDADAMQMNLRYQKRETQAAALTVCAWGTRGREDDIRRLTYSLAAWDVKPHHLGLTKGGQPKHPLYLRGATKPSADWFTSEPTEEVTG